MSLSVASIVLAGASALACGAGAALALPAGVDALLARKRRVWLKWFDEKMAAWETFCACNGRYPGGPGAPASEQVLAIWAADARRLAGSDILGAARSAHLLALNLPDPDAERRSAIGQAYNAASAQVCATAAACVPGAFKDGGAR